MNSSAQLSFGREGTADPGRLRGAVWWGSLRIGMMGMLLLRLLATGVQAHPISISSAVVDVRTNQVLVEMNIMTEDLVLYHDVEAGEDFRIPADTLKSTAKKHGEFLLKYFTVRDAAGDLLAGGTEEIDDSQIDPEGLYPADLMTYSVVYRFEYPLEKAQDFLTFAQNFGGDDSALPSMMDLMVLQNGQYLEEPVQIGPRVPHSVRFDWVNGPPEPPSDWKEIAERREQKKNEYLGITSYSGLYSYIYIEQHEVRHEILIPVLSFETWESIAREDKDFLSVEEQEAAREVVKAFFRENNPVTIDGIEVEPVLDRLDFYGLDFRDFARRPEPRRVSVYQARMGAILSYSTKGAPGTVKMNWDSFNKHTPFVRSLVYVYDTDAETFYFEPNNSEFVWKAEDHPELAEQNRASTLAQIPPAPEQPRLKAPVYTFGLLVVTLVWIVGSCVSGRRSCSESVRRRWPLFVLALLLLFVQREIDHPFRSAPQPSPDEAGSIFASLHKNIYRAFDYRGEDEIYDALERSVDGELLSGLYLQIQEGLKMEEQGGAVSRIREVEIVDGGMRKAGAEDAEGASFGYDCTWTVRGTVEHWGHVHTRVNEFHGRFTVEAIDRRWKITGFEILDRKRLKFETGLRKVKS